MHRLKAITPLGADAPREDVIGAITIREKVDQALISVAARTGQNESLSRIFADKLNLTLPEPGKAARAGEYAAFWAAPEQWMLTAPLDDHPTFTAEIKGLVDASASIVEQTDGWAWFEISGPSLADMLARLSMVDLHSFPPGSATRSLVEHLSVFLWRETEDGVTMIGPRSSAGSLHHGLITAARSIA